MERELLMTGIGGQGIQLAATVIARAAMAEGREVQVFGSYGGMMRGGNTDAAVVIADSAIEAPPTVAQAWSAILMHPAHAAQPLRMIRPGGFCLVNVTVFGEVDEQPGRRTIALPATQVALELGNVVAASMVMVGAYAAATGVVELTSLAGAARESLPSYRTAHIELNERALRAGFDAVACVVEPAWTATAPVAP